MLQKINVEVYIVLKFYKRLSNFYILLCQQLKRDFLKSYIRKGEEVLILRIGAKTWPVKCSVNSKRLSLSWGWREFAKDNALAVGDVCVFELVKPSKKLIHVVIFRAASPGVQQQ